MADPAGRLALWAEDGALPRVGLPRRGRPPRLRRPRPHPYALGADDIRLGAADLGGFAAGDLVAEAHEVELRLRRPEVGGGPIASPWMEDAPPAADPSSFMAADTAAGGQDEADIETGPDAEVPDEVLRSYMWGVIDALARRFVADRPPEAQPSSRRRLPGKPTATDAWLAALVSPDGIVDAADNELGLPSEALRSWQATENTEAEAVRTCFRSIPSATEDADDSEEPAAGGDETRRSTGRRRRAGRPEPVNDRRIEFALQAVADPSLLVSAEAVGDDDPELTALERYAAHPDEHLLRGLGRAARPSLHSVPRWPQRLPAGRRPTPPAFSPSCATAR